MTIAFRMVNFTIKNITRTACIVDDSELSRVPMQGPFLLVSNHINFMDIPLLYTHLLPRKVSALVKEETWKNPFMAALFDLWGGIPIKRGEYDLQAFSKTRQVLNAGGIVAVSPEGTRSRTGILQKGHAGVVILAQKMNVPILPVAIYGGERIWDNLHRLARTPFHIRVGDLIQIKSEIPLNDREQRQQVTDQVMYQIAQLMPEKYRGFYADLTNQHNRFFIPSTRQ